MLIKSRMGISADGFVSTPEGVPAIALADGFEPMVTHGYPEFIEGGDAAGWCGTDGSVSGRLLRR